MRSWIERCSVRPGITGLAQALLRSEGTEEQRLALDLQYVREAGLLLDLKIMAWTFGRLSGRADRGEPPKGAFLRTQCGGDRKIADRWVAGPRLSAEALEPV